MTPTVNVNLSKCTCVARLSDQRPDDHPYPCGAAAPVSIPCPIPRSVTISVALGECDCIYPALANPPVDPHRKTCPARPVRVSCSISGKTWEESEAQEVDLDDVHPHALTAAVNACRDRWALVKALVLGMHGIVGLDASTRVHDLERQRDAVFAALADMARAEDAAVAAQRALAPFRIQARRWVHLVRQRDRPSADYLAAYVDQLINQVGVLP